ncbi:MAG: hypothetical protein ACKOFF_06525 [Acidimicrobiales bacterium]
MPEQGPARSLRSERAVVLARLAVAGMVPAWDELRRRYHPVIELWSRRYCNQIAHRMPPGSRGRFSCRGRECDRAFWPAYEALLVHLLGDSPGAEKRRKGRIDEWAGTDIDNDDFSRRVTKSFSGGGRMTDVFRNWCSSLGIPQRARVPANTEPDLRDAIAGHVDELFPDLDAEAAVRLVRPAVWLDALHWDAAQAGLTSEIDHDRVHRAVADGDETLLSLDHASFARLCEMVDDTVAAVAPDFHASYLATAREITRVPVDLAHLSENDLQEFEDRGGWV